MELRTWDRIDGNGAEPANSRFAIFRGLSICLSSSCAQMGIRCRLPVNMRGGPGWTVPASALSGEQTMAEVTTWIWEEKGQEHQVEITLRDGSTRRPSSYAAGLKSQDVGICGTPNDQGGLRLRAIAWDAIALVSVLNLTDEIDDLLS